LSKAPIFDATDAVKKFHKLANQRTDADNKKRHPFELHGSKHNADRAANPDASNAYLELRSGDLVCFRAENGRIAEVAISSIWRREIDDCHKFFEAVNPELLPFNSARQTISIAEQMFGFVEQNLSDPSVPVTNARALAGRVRFSFGTLEDCPGDTQHGCLPFYSVPKDNAIVMRILSFPKPPSPSLYFRRANGTGPVTKKDLKVADHRPMGRKMYLHHPGHPQWRTNAPNDNKDQKVRVSPVRPHMSFYFHIDFDNLTERELGLLCYSLRPTEAFRHKLGMGKPLGLGTVRIDPLTMLLISRSGRYAIAEDASLETDRYHLGWFAWESEVSNLPARYEREKLWIERHRTPAQQLISQGALSVKSFTDLRNVAASSMIPAIRTALERIGDPGYMTAPVHYPLQRDQNGETEGFKWFMLNDDPQNNQKQQLAPIQAQQPSLPILRRN
jgi:CRISPR-associated protein (TIGR03986 family)